MDGLVGDHARANQDQQAFDRAGEILHLRVPVHVLGVGRLVGLPDREVGNDGSDQVDRGVDRLRHDRDRARHHSGGELQGDQRQVREDGEARGACLCGHLRLSLVALRSR